MEKTVNYKKKTIKNVNRGSVYEISLVQAATYTKAWADNKAATANDNLTVHDGHFIKAFLIDAKELKDILTNTYYTTTDDLGKQPTYIRVYLGLDEAQEDYRKEKLIAVPVDEYGNDIIKRRNSSEESTDEDANPNSNIYDFTLPCPPTCDIQSDLYFGPTNKN